MNQVISSNGTVRDNTATKIYLRLPFTTIATFITILIMHEQERIDYETHTHALSHNSPALSCRRKKDTTLVHTRNELSSQQNGLMISRTRSS